MFSTNPRLLYVFCKSISSRECWLSFQIGGNVLNSRGKHTQELFANDEVSDDVTISVPEPRNKNDGWEDELGRFLNVSIESFCTALGKCKICYRQKLTDRSRKLILHCKVKRFFCCTNLENLPNYWDKFDFVILWIVFFSSKNTNLSNELKVSRSAIRRTQNHHVFIFLKCFRLWRNFIF